MIDKTSAVTLINPRLIKAISMFFSIIKYTKIKNCRYDDGSIHIHLKSTLRNRKLSSSSHFQIVYFVTCGSFSLLQKAFQLFYSLGICFFFDEFMSIVPCKKGRCSCVEESIENSFSIYFFFDLFVDFIIVFFECFVS